MNISSSTTANNFIGFNVNGVEKMRMDSAGNLGIGTTTPARQLDITGKINVTNDYTGAYDSTKAAITVNSTVNNAPAIYVTGSGAGWGSGVIFRNTTASTGRDYGIYSASDGTFCITDVTGSLCRMNISPSGYIAIANSTNTSSWPLLINSSAATGTITANSYIQVGNSAIQTSVGVTYNWPFSVVTSGSFRCGGDLVFYSDSRIKTNIQDVNDDMALNVLRQLQPKTYEYIDKFSRTSETVYGFIAQEVRQVIPSAVAIQSEFVPNFMRYGRMVALSSDVLKKEYVYELTSSSPLQFSPRLDASGAELSQEAHRILLYDYNNKKYQASVVTSGEDGVVFTVLMNEAYEMPPLDYDSSNGDVWIYGQEVTDFHCLKKDAIWTVAASALQEVDRQQTANRERINALTCEIANVQSQIDAQQVTINYILSKLP